LIGHASLQLKLDDDGEKPQPKRCDHIAHVPLNKLFIFGGCTKWNGAYNENPNHDLSNQTTLLGKLSNFNIIADARVPRSESAYTMFMKAASYPLITSCNASVLFLQVAK
jgi:hypothetical protein